MSVSGTKLPIKKLGRAAMSEELTLRLKIVLELNLGIDFKNPARDLPFVWQVRFHKPGKMEF